MQGLEVTVLLGLAILVGTVLAPRLRIATPLLLVVIGLLLGFFPELREIQLPPETVLLLFLPVMLFWESLTTSLRAIRRSLRYIVPMSTLLVVASAFAVAWIATLFGMPWQTGLLLGAAVAPPDATAVAALGRLLPQRMFMKLKAESLTNDGTALVLYAIALSLALGDSVTAWSVTATALVSYLGGAAAGIAMAALTFVALRRSRNALVINITTHHDGRIPPAGGRRLAVRRLPAQRGAVRPDRARGAVRRERDPPSSDRCTSAGDGLRLGRAAGGALHVPTALRTVHASCRRISIRIPTWPGCEHGCRFPRSDLARHRSVGAGDGGRRR